MKYKNLSPFFGLALCRIADDSRVVQSTELTSESGYQYSKESDLEYFCFFFCPLSALKNFANTKALPQFSALILSKIDPHKFIPNQFPLSKAAAWPLCEDWGCRSPQIIILNTFVKIRTWSYKTQTGFLHYQIHVLHRT